MHKADQILMELLDTVFHHSYEVFEKFKLTEAQLMQYVEQINAYRPGAILVEKHRFKTGNYELLLRWPQSEVYLFLETGGFTKMDKATK